MDILKTVSSGKYNRALVPDHPFRNKHKYVLEHRVVMENHLERLLSKDEVVHHINGDTKDNRIENLEVMDRIKHAREHGGRIGKRFGVFECPSCGNVFVKDLNQSSVVIKNKKLDFCSRECIGYFRGKNKTIERYLVGIFIAKGNRLPIMLS